jgi:hypothetical protein
MKFRVLKKETTEYYTRSGIREDRACSRKSVEWLIKTEDNQLLDGYELRRHAVEAGKNRGWIQVR